MAEPQGVALPDSTGGGQSVLPATVRRSPESARRGPRRLSRDCYVRPTQDACRVEGGGSAELPTGTVTFLFTHPGFV